MRLAPYAAELDRARKTLAIARRVGVHEANEVEPGRFRNAGVAGFVGFEFEPAPEARYLVLPGLRADTDLTICWCDQRLKWRPGQGVRWLKSRAGSAEAVIDLERLIHLRVKPLTRIAIQFTGPGGEFALTGSPRLLR